MLVRAPRSGTRIRSSLCSAPPQYEREPNLCKKRMRILGHKPPPSQDCIRIATKNPLLISQQPKLLHSTDRFLFLPLLVQILVFLLF